MGGKKKKKVRRIREGKSSTPNKNPKGDGHFWITGGNKGAKENRT